MSGHTDDVTAWGSISDISPGTATGRVNYGTKVQVGEAEAFVGVSLIRATGQMHGKVELNPSRVLDGSGWGLAGAEDVEGCVERAWPAVLDLMTPLVPVAQSRVRRLDVARDFAGVEHAGGLIRGLAPVNRPWAKRNLVHADPKRHGAQTLMVGSGAGIVRLYDKAAETKGEAPGGSVRWEAEARGDWCEKYGEIKYLGDVTAKNCERLARDRWEWSAMGNEVGAGSRIIDVVERSGLSDREQTMFLGWLMRQAAGRHWDASRTTLAKFRQVQRQLGIVIDPAMFENGEGGRITSRLDFDSGREVLSIAA